MDIYYSHAKTREELEQIKELQAANLPNQITKEEATREGYVTVVHHLALLEQMNTPYPHTIAKTDEAVIGYALSMPRLFSGTIPILVPMFEQIDRLIWKGKLLAETNYIVMGQVCISKSWRGKNVFTGLYSHMQSRMTAYGFDCIVTEIAANNTRSLRAHEKVGFTELGRYATGDVEWVIVIL